MQHIVPVPVGLDNIPRLHQLMDLRAHRQCQYVRQKL